MARHGTPAKDSEGNGKVELDAAALAELAKEPEGGRHSEVDEETDEGEVQE
jgi:hypothetical protein